MLVIQKPTPLIVGIPGTALDADTRSMLLKLRPTGFILFKRNCENREQLKQLCADLSELSPYETPLIFVDQEGGRVVRIGWEDYIAPPAKEFGDLYKYSEEHALTLAKLNGFVLAAQLREYGITVNCLPVADVAIEGTHDVIGDRAFSRNPEIVSALCGATMAGMFAGGNWPIIKHAPGHGRARTDSHKELPVVDEIEKELMKSDFYPFFKNNMSPFVMTAHIVYPRIDALHCATQSEKVINDIIRGKLGMKGLIVSDDLNMEALEGSIRERAEEALNAGCDLLLHCSGKLEEMETLVGIREISESAENKIKTLPTLGVPEAEEVKNAREALRTHFNR